MGPAFFCMYLLELELFRQSGSPGFAIGAVDGPCLQYAGDQDLAHIGPVVEGGGALVGDADAVQDGGVGFLTAGQKAHLFAHTLSLISGKYKMTILYTLSEFGVVRFNEMKRYIGGVSFKTLSTTLKELEADGLVHREEYPQVPPKVEYSLTRRGQSLMPLLDGMCRWGEENRQ